VNLDLPNTKSSAILTALTDARHRSGVAALGMVLTLVVEVNETDHHDALRAAMSAAREHPCRIVTLIKRTASSPARLDAEIRVGDDNSLAEVIILRLYGELRNHADSVVLPLLLPDAPVLVWWPGQSPAVPSKDALGALAQRRVTDAAASAKPLAALKARCDSYAPGDTDFAWTRLTPWRTLLAAALDQPFDSIVSAEVGAARNNPSAELLATWLEFQLGISVARKVTRGPGITGVELLTQRGELTIIRPDGRLATLVRTGQPDRRVALPRRDVGELLAEEVRRLDPDDIYDETICRVFGAKPARSFSTSPARRPGRASGRRSSPTTRESTSARALDARIAATDSSDRAGSAAKQARTAAAKSTAAKSTAAKSTAAKKTAAKNTAKAPTKRPSRSAKNKS
jgi:glucose-6-phosphate dehydrogenase assembly protein OpcA